MASGDVTAGDHTPLSSHPGETPIDSAVPDAALTIQLLFPSKLAIYNGGCIDRHPEIIIIGDTLHSLVPSLTASLVVKLRILLN